MGNIVGAIVLGVIAIICFVFTRLYNFINEIANPPAMLGRIE